MQGDEAATIDLVGVEAVTWGPVVSLGGGRFQRVLHVVLAGGREWAIRLEGPVGPLAFQLEGSTRSP